MSDPISNQMPEAPHGLAPGLTPLLPLPAEVTVIHPPRDRYWLHALLLLATVFTTLVVGAGMQFSFQNNLAPYSADDNAVLSFFPVEWVIHQPARLLLGIPFSFTLLLILLCHEMGHYVYCHRYRVWATLPFFIPFPSLAGTMGAFIRIRGALRSRAALFDIDSFRRWPLFLWAYVSRNPLHPVFWLLPNWNTAFRWFSEPHNTSWPRGLMLQSTHCRWSMSTFTQSRWLLGWVFSRHRSTCYRADNSTEDTSSTPCFPARIALSRCSRSESCFL
jgi:hypothetical protein